MKLKNKIKFIYFDLDNTLWDFKKNSVMALERLYDKKIKNLKRGNIDFQTFKNIYEKHNSAMWRAYERQEITPEVLKIKRFEKTIEELQLNEWIKATDLNDVYIHSLPSFPYLMPNAKEILEYLVSQYSLGILSNGFEDTQYRKLQSGGIVKYFDIIITSDQVGCSKPNEGIFQYAIKKSGCSPKEIVYVGDDYKIDILAANKMNIIGILLDPQNKMKEDSIIKIKDLIELKNYL
ncbi:YjjG family noncanonical pyrimidine nucleotidase [Garciella nitratireducens]|uniref:Putative hydrolase of the HAD superfamily n=1 Tax=Garciella nitratireducens DSM 15102 TaxID=1121911 RepID=A0A1T4KHP3_9FIRM|nr:YjjG family noncanonical pyrimidine nucleotidase [Garciella nitratireducens]SJZ41886.1 putative hydrolase of the HAD superfamily [Garciella nitratireducens DSM 15102]